MIAPVSWSARWAARSVAAAVLALAVAGCGGGDGGSDPIPVANVDAVPETVTLYVGETRQATARTMDVQGNDLPDRRVTWSSSAASVAAVSDSGLIRALGPGTAQITAASEGRQDVVTLTVLAPVAEVRVEPATLSLLVGEERDLAVSLLDAGGNALSDRTIAFSTNSPAVATVTLTGHIRAEALGIAQVTVTSETRSATVQVSVVPPPETVQLTSVTPALLLPGGSATITGGPFSPIASENVVVVNDVPATVTAATPTELVITLGAAGYPCEPTGPRPITVNAAGERGSTSHPMKVATQLSIARGADIRLSGAAARCNELVEGLSYVLSVANVQEAPAPSASYVLRGRIAAPAAAAASSPASMAGGPPPSASVASGSLPALSAPLAQRAAHARLREQDRALLNRLGSPVRALREKRAKREAESARTAVFRAVTPTVGAINTMRIRRPLDSPCDQYASVQARTVYVGTHSIVLEDVASPLAGTMDDYYADLGQEYDEVMHPIITANFGDPFKLDPLTDNNSRLVMLFSPVVNDLGNVLGFVSGCDFFPPGEDGIEASNLAEIFYAVVPTSAAPGFLNNSLDPESTKDAWRWNVRSTLIHEVKHITSVAERLAREVSQEETWLEEATAQVAVELYARGIYGTPWKANTNYVNGPYCDVRPSWPQCAGRPDLLYHPLSFLQQHYGDPATRSVIDGSESSIYGSSWSLVRWAIDHYAASESAFLQALTQQTPLTGIENLQARTGRTFEQMLSDWALAMATDDHANFAPSRPQLTMPSWQFRDIFAGMNTDFPNTYTRPYPPVSQFVSRESFAQTVSTMQGGTARSVELDLGSSAVGYAVELATTSASLRLNIVRLW